MDYMGDGATLEGSDASFEDDVTVEATTMRAAANLSGGRLSRKRRRQRQRRRQLLTAGRDGAAAGLHEDARFSGVGHFDWAKLFVVKESAVLTTELYYGDAIKGGGHGAQ